VSGRQAEQQRHGRELVVVIQQLVEVDRIEVAEQLAKAESEQHAGL